MDMYFDFNLNIVSRPDGANFLINLRRVLFDTLLFNIFAEVDFLRIVGPLFFKFSIVFVVDR